MCLSEHAARRIFIAFNWSNISQAMVSKKVMLARAAEASRKTSPDEASWHSSRNEENKMNKSRSFLAAFKGNIKASATCNSDLISQYQVHKHGD